MQLALLSHADAIDVQVYGITTTRGSSIPQVAELLSAGAVEIWIVDRKISG